MSDIVLGFVGPRLLGLLPMVGRLVVTVAPAVVVASAGLLLAAPHYAPQDPQCAWSFSAPDGGLPPSAAGPNCGPAVTARPLAVKRGMPLPVLLLRARGVTLGPLALAMLLAILVGVPLGAWAAARPGSRPAQLLLGMSTFGLALPGFLISFGVVMVEIWLVGRTGHPLLRFLDYRFDPAHVAMPTLALAGAPTALLAQTTAATLGNIYDQDYVRAARSRGIEGLRLLVGHILPVAIGPLLATVAAGAQITLSTIPLLEYLFNWPGLGYLLLDALEGQDRAAFAAGAAIFAVAFTALGLLGDRAGAPARVRRDGATW